MRPRSAEGTGVQTPMVLPLPDLLSDAGPDKGSHAKKRKQEPATRDYTIHLHKHMQKAKSMPNEHRHITPVHLTHDMCSLEDISGAAPRSEYRFSHLTATNSTGPRLVSRMFARMYEIC